jgi:Rrf2 family iron-sulfur cluster assembly transcriptional regulator
MSEPYAVSEAANLALHGMALLAGRPGDHVTARNIARALAVSEAHLAKVMGRLERAGLVTGLRGPAGGYRLARPAREIFLNQIFEAVEGKIEARPCLFGIPVCDGSGCALGDYFGAVNRRVADKLARTRLSDIKVSFGGTNAHQS